MDAANPPVVTLDAETPPIVDAAPVEPSVARSRSPARAAVVIDYIPNVPPSPRPKVDGTKTPKPPLPRSKHLGVRTPVPPTPSSGLPASGYIVTVPKRRARPSEDLDKDYRLEFPTIEESFVEQSSGSRDSGSNISDWTTEQWQNYNRVTESLGQQEALSSGSSSSVAAVIAPPITAPPADGAIWVEHEGLGRGSEEFRRRSPIRRILSLD